CSASVALTPGVVAQPTSSTRPQTIEDRRRINGAAYGATSLLARQTRILDHMRMGPHMMLGSDNDAVKGARLQRSAVRRAWQFARPYRAIIIFFLVTICISAVLELVPPFAFRSILDDAIPK